MYHQYFSRLTVSCKRSGRTEQLCEREVFSTLCNALGHSVVEYCGCTITQQQLWALPTFELDYGSITAHNCGIVRGSQRIPPYNARESPSVAVRTNRTR